MMERSLTPSSLGRFQGRAPSTADDQYRLGAAAWHKLGYIGDFIDQIDDEWLRQALINLGNRKYGKRTKDVSNVQSR